MSDSTRRAIPRWGCVTGRRGYPDHDTAEAVLGRIWAQPRPGRRLECRTYRCDHCGLWHLTSMSAEQYEASST